MRSFAAFCMLLTISLLPAWAQQDVITTFIGGGPNDIPALQANLGPYGVALDVSGNLYIAASNRVYKVDTSGILTVIAGTGVAGYGGDGVSGGATSALLNDPAGIVVDNAGNIYVSEYNNHTIRKIDATNTITTIAGVSGQCNYNGDGDPATNYHLCHPQGLALDGSGNLYIADSGNYRVRKLALLSDTISTYAGTGLSGYAGDGGAATSAKLNWPAGVAADSAGDLFINDQNNFRVREVAFPTGIITTVAGTGVNGFSGDGGPATLAKLGSVQSGITVDSAGTTVTFVDTGNNRVRQFTVGSDINTVAGTGSASFCGDGGRATNACLHSSQGIAIAGSGLVYVGDSGNSRVRAFTVGGDINTVAGNGNTAFPTLVSGVPPQGVVLNNPDDLLVDPAGNVFVSDGANCIVRELVKGPPAVVNIFAGLVNSAANATTGTCGFSGAGGPAANAELGTLRGIARDSSGNLYIADQTNCVVWQVSAANSTISIFAGVTPKKCGYNGDDIPAASAELNAPAGIFVDSKDNLYIGDNSNNRVRKVTSGTISTIAGNGTAGYLGDGDPATIAELNVPSGVAVDRTGNVFITDNNNCVVREVAAATGIINTIAGIPTVCGFNGDGAATEHELKNPGRVEVDANGNVFITDNGNQLLRWVSPEGIMTTIAGNGKAGLTGDGGSAINAELNSPGGIAQDALGNFLVADYNNLRIREVAVFSALNTSDSSLDFGLVTVGATSGPQFLTLSALGPLAFSNITTTGPFTEYDNCGALANAATCTMYVYLKPTAAGPQTGTITIEDTGFFSDTTTISLEGTGAAVSVTGGPLLFGNQAVNTTGTAKTVTVTNQSAKSVTMKAITLNDVDFAITSKTCPAPGSALAAKASCTISVAFAPKTTGAKKGALIINDSDPSSPQIVGLTGTGTSLVVLTPGSLAFGAQAVGTTSALKKVTLTNNTGATTTLKNPPLSVTGPFLTTGASTCTKNLAVAAGGTCVIYVEFKPTAAGYPTGTLSVFDSDSTSPQTVALSGIATGVQFAPNPVNLTTSVGHQISTAVTITNVSTSTIPFMAWTITGPNGKDFTANLADPPCGGSLAPASTGAVCTFTLYFTPSIAGSESATLQVYDSSTGNPQSLPLTGTGQ